MARTLADMVAEVRWMADAEGQDDVTGRHSRAAIVRAINLAARAMRARVSMVAPNIFVDASVDDVTEPWTMIAPGEDVTHVLAVQMRRGSVGDGQGAWFPLERVPMEEVWRMQSLEAVGIPRVWASRRKSDGDWEINFAPLQDATYAMRVLYQREHTDLVSDGDTLDGVDGFEAVVCLDAAVRLAMRDGNSDGRMQPLMAERDRAEKMMLDAARPRGGTSAKTVYSLQRVRRIRGEPWPA